VLKKTRTGRRILPESLFLGRLICSRGYGRSFIEKLTIPYARSQVLSRNNNLSGSPRLNTSHKLGIPNKKLVIIKEKSACRRS